MDHFGIGQALRCAADIYFRGARRSGRTTSLIESLKTGDRVVFVHPHESDHVRRLAKELGADVECIVINPERDPVHELLKLGTPKGRLIFDHSWIEIFYLSALAQVANDIDRMQREMSGRGMAHVETKLRAHELAKWRF